MLNTSVKTEGTEHILIHEIATLLKCVTMTMK